MHSQEPQIAFGIVQVNSIEYVDLALKALSEKRIFVPLKSCSDIRNFDYLQIKRVITPEKKFGWYQPNFSLPEDENIAQISYTSGTEGEPKGIILTYGNLKNTVDRLISVMKITSDIKEYIGVPVYHSFGYGRIRVCNQVGGKAYIPESGFNPKEIASLLANNEINGISAVPTQWRILLQQRHLFEKTGNRIKWIEIGSQYMAREEKELLCQIFPKARIVQHYGLTEASRTTFLIISEKKYLDSVGCPFGDTELRLTKENLIQTKGSHVAKHKITSSGIESLIDQDGWFTTSDIGKIQDDYLTFLGRSDDIVNIGGLKVSPDDLERHIAAKYGTTGCISFSKIKDPLKGEALLLNVIQDSQKSIDIYKAQTFDILNGLNIKLGGHLPVQVVDSFPKTDTGKIQRQALAKKYQSNIQQLSNKPALKGLIEKLRFQFNMPYITAKDSFLSLNGDSLLLVGMMAEVEAYLGYIPENWEAIPFGQLEELKTNSEPTQEKNSTNKLLGLTIFFLISALIVGELFLQVRSHIKTGRSVLNLLGDESTVIFNKELGVKTYRPNIQIKDVKTGKTKYDINELGLRSPTIPNTPEPDELRIAVVGASTVAGAFAESNDDTFPAILNKHLSEKLSRKVNVINGGIEGLALEGIGIITEKLVMPLEPEFVVIYTGFNDITKICRMATENTAPELEPLFPVPQTPNWLMSADMIKKNTVFLRQAPKVKSVQVDPKSVDTSWYRESIEKTINTIKSSGATPVLMTNARSYINAPDGQAKSLAAMSLYYYYCLDFEGIISIGQKLNSEIRAVAKKYKLPLVDLAKNMPGGNAYFIDSGHFTLNGEKFVAKQLVDYFFSKDITLK